MARLIKAHNESVEIWACFKKNTHTIDKEGIRLATTVCNCNKCEPEGIYISVGMEIVLDTSRTYIYQSNDIREGIILSKVCNAIMGYIDKDSCNAEQYIRDN